MMSSHFGVRLSLIWFLVASGGLLAACSDDSAIAEGAGGEGGGIDVPDLSLLLGDVGPTDAGPVIADAEADACVPAGDELCNGIDDDCDGTADEGFDGVGEACTVGLGACAVEGITICLPDGSASACEGEPGMPAVGEVCNTVDDDCDGVVDEGYTVGAFCQFNEGECNSRGEEVCTADGAGTECDAEPIVVEEEKCDGLDNDCDGTADEGIELGGLCEEGVGLCRRGGFVECDEEGNVYCTAVPGDPREEACNGFDDDCDDFADEDFGAEPCEAGVGGCLRDGQTVCQADGSLLCNAVPGDPAGELCNGIDDDCDGSADEDFGGQAGGPCQNGEGVCARFGEFVCSPDGREVICGAEPAGEPAEAEICNELDDDCDGTADEEIEGVGIVCNELELMLCQAGITFCTDAGEIECRAVELEPGDEFCNQIDDDCDGTTDEAFPELGEACSVGAGACLREGIYTCEDIGGNVGGLGARPRFVGIQQNLAEADILDAGFVECWRGRYDQREPPVAQVIEACSEDILMLGCRPAGNENLTLAAMGERAFVLADQAQNRNPVNLHNEVNWYFSDRWSWGFAPPGEAVSRNSCDTGNTLPAHPSVWKRISKFLRYRKYASRPKDVLAHERRDDERRVSLRRQLPQWQRRLGADRIPPSEWPRDDMQRRAGRAHRRGLQRD
jgi:hypothetical protein